VLQQPEGVIMPPDDVLEHHPAHTVRWAI